MNLNLVVFKIIVFKIISFVTPFIFLSSAFCQWLVGKKMDEGLCLGIQQRKNSLCVCGCAHAHVCLSKVFKKFMTLPVL